MADFDPDRFMTERPSGTPMMTVRPRKLDRDEAERLVRKYNPDITRAAVAGEVDNIMRESGGNAANDTGDHGTSGGLYQHHNQRLTGLKSFAAKQGTDWRDPETQVRYSRMEKERDYPGLLKLQQNTHDRGQAEDAFKRIFERPASVLWQNNAQGQPVLGNYSDYAMKEHEGRPNTDVLMMTPWEYLDLTPALEGRPFESPAGKSLMKSGQKGEPIESIPTLDVNVNGPTATVTDQDGRHRALLAQQNGEEAIPVAVRRTGEGDPKEIVGMTGKLQAMDYPKAQPRVQQQEQPKEPISLMGKIGEALIPSAHAESTGEIPPWERDQQASESVPPWERDQQALQPPAAEQPHDSMLGSLAQGASKGFGDTLFAGQELVGKGMQALGIPGGESLTQDARERMAAEQAKAAPDQAAHPYATGIGDFLGGMAFPAGAAGVMGKAGVNAMRTAAATGAIGGALSPVGKDEGFWGTKALETGLGTAAGMAGQKVGNALSKIAGGALRQGVDMLMKEGVELTPGQMAGGTAKRIEDIMASFPGLGSVIRAAQKRSIESFNHAAINRSLDDIGTKLPKDVKAGHDAIDFAQRQFNNAYDQVIPRMTGQLDNGFRNDMVDVITKAQRENLPPEYLDQLRYVIGQEIVSRFSGGTLTGKQAQTIGTQLDALIKPLMTSDNPYKQKLGQYLRQADRALDDMMARHNPVLQAEKDKIDAGYAKFKIVQNAGARINNGQMEQGVFSPAQLNRAVRDRDRSKDKGAFARGAALLQDLADAGRNVLPQRVADSGTPERLVMMGLLGGLEGAGAYGGASSGLLFEPHTLAAMGAAAAPYTPPVSKAINAGINWLASMPGGSTQRAVADALRRFGGPGLAAGFGSQAGSAAPGTANLLPSGAPQQ